MLAIQRLKNQEECCILLQMSVNTKGPAESCHMHQKCFPGKLKKAFSLFVYLTLVGRKKK